VLSPFLTKNSRLSRINVLYFIRFKQVLPFMSGKGDPLRVLNGKKAQASYQPAFIVPVGD